jgi:hypothetical protein
MEADEEQLTVVEVDPERANDKVINSRNDLLKDRRTEQYR